MNGFPLSVFFFIGPTGFCPFARTAHDTGFRARDFIFARKLRNNFARSILANMLRFIPKKTTDTRLEPDSVVDSN